MCRQGRQKGARACSGIRSTQWPPRGAPGCLRPHERPCSSRGRKNRWSTTDPSCIKNAAPANAQPGPAERRQGARKHHINHRGSPLALKTPGPINWFVPAESNEAVVNHRVNFLDHRSRSGRLPKTTPGRAPDSRQPTDSQKPP